MSWGSRGSPHPKYFCMPARAGTSQLLSPCIPGGVPLLGAPCILISLWRASPSQTASAPAQTQKNSLARHILPLGPGWITGLELGIPARVTPCSQRCWASTVLQPCFTSPPPPSCQGDLEEGDTLKAFGGGRWRLSMAGQLQGTGPGTAFLYCTLLQPAGPGAKAGSSGRAAAEQDGSCCDRRHATKPP